MTTLADQVLPRIRTRADLHWWHAANAQGYRYAARRLARMRRIAAGTPEQSRVEELIAELRETPRRRPRLQAEFSRAGLP